MIFNCMYIVCQLSNLVALDSCMGGGGAKYTATAVNTSSIR